MTANYRVDSTAVHAGREDLVALGVHAAPIDLSSTSPLPGIGRGGESYESITGGGYPLPEGGPVYGRLWNTTVARFESALAQLERAETSVAFASGMAAVTAAVIAATCLGEKHHVVAIRPLYGGTDHLLASGLIPGVETTFCSEHEVAASLRRDTALVILETPANPTLEVVDIAAVVRDAAGVPVLVDNTFATPILQNPILHGAAMSLHSATKYIGGHGDVVAGVIACDEATARQLRRVRVITGGILHPLGAYLLHRGLSTLPVRVRAQESKARTIAAWLKTHPAVDRVYYPEYDIERRAVLERQMSGTGAMISIALHGGYQAAERLTTGVQLFGHAVSLGGVDSLIQHPAALTHRAVEAESRPSDSIVRLSIGLEDAQDLIEDLKCALDQTAK